jgi:hypothetical protein
MTTKLPLVLAFGFPLPPLALLTLLLAHPLGVPNSSIV